MSTNVTTLGERIQEAREAKGLTRAELAVAAQSTEAAIRMWEGDHREPKVRYLLRIANATGRDVAWFLEGAAA